MWGKTDRGRSDYGGKSKGGFDSSQGEGSKGIVPGIKQRGEPEAKKSIVSAEGQGDKGIVPMTGGGSSPAPKD